MKLRALFDNGDEELFPNQFVNARLTVETLHDATLVPNGGILQGSPGAYVYLMDGDDKVVVRPIKTGETDGTRTVVLSGLKPGDRVVTDGTDRLKDGAKVRVTEGAQASTGQDKATQAAGPQAPAADAAKDAPTEGAPQQGQRPEGGRKRHRQQGQ